MEFVSLTFGSSLDEEDQTTESDPEPQETIKRLFCGCGGILVSIETETEIQKELDDLDLGQTDRRRKESCHHQCLSG